MAKAPTNPAQFRRWLQAEIAWLQSMEAEPDPCDYASDAANLLDDARAIAARLGLPKIVAECSGYSVGVSIYKAQQVLAACLAALEPTDGPLTVQQAAERLNISQRKVYDLCAAGLLRHTKRPIRIRPADLEAYQSTQRQTSLKSLPLRHLK